MDKAKPDYMLFNPTSKDKFWTMLRSEFLQWVLNRTPIWNIPKRNWLIKKLFGTVDSIYCVMSPFHCFFGNNIHVGKNFFANYNCVIMAHADVQIGDNVLIAPNVSIITVAHPKLAEERAVKQISNSFEPHGRGDWEIIAPITIGDNVWLCTNVTVCPGVTIGSNSIIGAGSVVTKDIPEGVLAFGTPCEVIRPITEEDRVGL